MSKSYRKGKVMAESEKRRLSDIRRQRQQARNTKYAPESQVTRLPGEDSYDTAYDRERAGRQGLNNE